MKKKSLLDFGKEYQDFEFSNFRDEIVDTVKKRQYSDADNIFSAELIIEKNNSERIESYTSTLNLYFRTLCENEETVDRIQNVYTHYGFTNLIPSIQDSLNNNGSVKLEFSADDIDEYLYNRELPINTSRNIRFDKLVISSVGITNKVEKLPLLIIIKDYTLYYKVSIFKHINGEREFLFDLLTSTLVGIKDSSIEKLHQTGSIELIYTV